MDVEERGKRMTIVKENVYIGFGFTQYMILFRK